MTKMLVLAGGCGTRLRSVVKDAPKPLALIGDTPFLYYQLEHWVAQGIKSFVFLLHYQAHLINDFIWQKCHKLITGCAVQLLVEPTPLDTGGAIAHAVQELNLREDFLVTNADTWIGGGVQEINNVGADSVIVVRQKETSRYGSIEIDDSGIVCGFCEKESNKKEGWINAGLCALHPGHFMGWDGQRMSLEKDIFPKLVISGRLRAVSMDLDFIDIGIPSDYQRFCEWQRNGRKDRLCN